MCVCVCVCVCVYVCVRACVCVHLCVLVSMYIGSKCVVYKTGITCIMFIPKTVGLCLYTTETVATDPISLQVSYSC